MSRQSIRLEAIDPIEIYGPANKNLEALCTYFPDLKVVARGTEIILDGKGWGHGVGLCQIGAAVMASKGYAYTQILEHYYPGTTI